MQYFSISLVIVTSGCEARRGTCGVMMSFAASSWKVLVVLVLIQSNRWWPREKAFLRSPVSSVNASLPPRSSFDLKNLNPVIHCDTSNTLVTISILVGVLIRSAYYQAKTATANVLMF